MEPAGGGDTLERGEVSREEDFLLACLRYTLDAQQMPAPQAPNGVDWQRLGNSMARHRVLGLCYLAGRQVPQAWPEDFQRALQADRYRDLVKRNAEAEQVGQVLNALHAAGIKAVVLKGWAAIAALYAGDYTLRPCVDIDILVPEEQQAATEIVLSHLGYSPEIELWPGFRKRYGNKAWNYIREQRVESGEPGQAWGSGEQGQVAGSGEQDRVSRSGEQGLVRGPGSDSGAAAGRSEGLAVDLHWGAFNLPYYDDGIPLGDWFERAEALEVCGAPAFQLGSEDSILFACGHMGLHHPGDDEVFRYYDLARKARQPGAGPDWDIVLRRAVDWRLAPPVKSILLRLETLFPGTLPAQAVSTLQALHIDPAEESAYRWFVRYNPTPLAGLRPRRWTPAAAGRAAGRLVEAFIPGPAFLNSRYGTRRFWPLHYLQRLANTLQQGGKFVRKR